MVSIPNPEPSDAPSAEAHPPVTFTKGGFLRGVVHMLPLCLFVVPFGIAFGVAATDAGLGPIQATAMSALIFTATSQFAALEFFDGPIAYLSLGIVAMVLSLRHVIMGAALSRWVNKLSAGRWTITLSFLTDANFADTQIRMQKGDTDVAMLLGGGLVLWATWTASTAIGAFGGAFLGDTDAYGFGAVMSCFFAAIAVGMMQETRGMLIPTVAAIGVAVATHAVLPTGWNVILAALVGGTIAAVQYRD